VFLKDNLVSGITWISFLIIKVNVCIYRPGILTGYPIEKLFLTHSFSYTFTNRGNIPAPRGCVVISYKFRWIYWRWSSR